jgi:hypothetical protein
MRDFANSSEWALLLGLTDWDICRGAAYLNYAPQACGLLRKPTTSLLCSVGPVSKALAPK